jgi:hypothetical protein
MAESQSVTLAFEPSDERPIRTAYRLVYQGFDEQHAQNLAKKLGVKGAVRYDDSEEGPAYTIEGENASLDLLPICFIYTHQNREEGDGNSGGITEAEAREKAEAFLSERDLLPRDAEFEEASRSQDGSVSLTAVNKSFPILFFAFPLFPPFMISVGFSPKGEIASIMHCWPGYEAVGDYTLLSEREAHQAMLRNPTESAPGVSVTINSFILSYYTATDAEEGIRYLAPVYCAMGVREREMGQDDTGCIAPVPAIPESLMRRGYPDWAPQRDASTPFGTEIP